MSVVGVGATVKQVMPPSISARRASRELRSTLAAAPADSRLIGIEHEYEVFVGNTKVDFRELVGTLTVLGSALDPGDRNSRRNAWGGITTADGWEAEIATPPVPIGPHFVDETLGHVTAGESLLRQSLGDDHRLVGYSTHVSVSVRDRRAPRTARRLAQRFSPALGLLIDNDRSPGLLIRPRFGRLELCGDHVPAARLGGVLVAVAAMVMAAESLPARRLPIRLDVQVEPAVGRHGLYVDRAAYGVDLYATGASANVRPRRGTERTAGEVLHECWVVSRPFVANLVHRTDLALGDDLVESLMTS